MTFTLALSGDSMITRGTVIGADEKAQQLQKLMQDADVAFTNLEVVASDVRGYHSSGAFTPTLIAASSVLDELVTLGIDVAGFANNHTLNLGVEGMLDTVKGLRDRRVACAGVGMTLAEATMPAYVDKPNGSVAVVACSTTFTSGDEATRPSDSMIGRPGLNPLRHRMRMGVTENQLAELARVHQALGLEEQMDYLREMRFLPPSNGADHLMFGGSFFAADEPHIETKCLPTDLERIRHWVSEAKARSDIAIVSVHSHENGSTLIEPAQFLVEFAHAAIDAGADVIVGHGPHRIRGIEVYRGKPIFYSLGNFVGQFELLSMLSSHSYDALFANADLPPHQVVGGSCLGFADRAEYWRSFVPVLSYDNRELTGIDIHPIGLGFDRPAPERGRPMIASPEEAAAVLGDLVRLSKAFDTEILSEGDSIRVQL
jgi:poly-gamma-glutamate capsule biosynthesis protein CapA/YwtB (metallophosphatase superfamily)